MSNLAGNKWKHHPSDGFKDDDKGPFSFPSLPGATVESEAYNVDEGTDADRDDEYVGLIPSATDHQLLKSRNISQEQHDEHDESDHVHSFSRILNGPGKNDNGVLIGDEVTYWSLIRDNIPYRLYLASYVTNYFGDWLTYLSSLSAIQVMLTQATTVVADQVQGDHDSDDDNNNDDDNWLHHSQTLISYLVVVRLMTSVIFSPLGGVLADGAWDRRYVMIVLDLCGAVIAWLFVWAVHVSGMEEPTQSGEDPQHAGGSNTAATTKGITWIFVATFLQQALSQGLYEPSRSALLPSLVMKAPGTSKHNDDGEAGSEQDKNAAKQQEFYQQQCLKKATIISGMAWSTVAALGSATGGFLVAQLGIRACFLVDCLTYILSAVFMYYSARLDHQAGGGGEYQRIHAATATTATTPSTIPTTTSCALDETTTTTATESLEHDVVADKATLSSPLSPSSVLQWGSFLYFKAKNMVWDGVVYTCTSSWGPLIFLKFSLLWLTMDVINVKLASPNPCGASSSSSNHATSSAIGAMNRGINGSTTTNDDWLASPNVPVDTVVPDNNESSNEEEAEVAFRLGLLFTGVGVGCLLGPLVAERFTNMQRLETLQLACVLSIGISAVACLCMGGMAVFVPECRSADDDMARTATPVPQALLVNHDNVNDNNHHLSWLVFGTLCILTSIRAMGISAAWINSSLLLQTFSSPQMLGRVSSFDFALALLGESASAITSGRLEDDYGWTPFQVSRGLGVLGLLWFVLWMVFHRSGKGAAAAAASSVATPEESVVGNGSLLLVSSRSLEAMEVELADVSYNKCPEAVA
ncbi:hypothetical protein ACA910_009522 [Epithemia clementina (nom. ined.)]